MYRELLTKVDIKALHLVFGVFLAISIMTWTKNVFIKQFEHHKTLISSREHAEQLIATGSSLPKKLKSTSESLAEIKLSQSNKDELKTDVSGIVRKMQSPNVLGDVRFIRINSSNGRVFEIGDYQKLNLEVQGRYADLYKYLQRLNQKHNRMLIQKFVIKKNPSKDKDAQLSAQMEFIIYGESNDIQTN